MTHWTKTFAAAAFSLAILSGCNGCPRGEHTPVLTKAEATQIANEAARKEGVDLSEWYPPEVRFESVDPDCTWIAFYEYRGATMPGHFMIYIHDRTKSTRIAGGM